MIKRAAIVPFHHDGVGRLGDVHHAAAPRQPIGPALAVRLERLCERLCHLHAVAGLHVHASASEKRVIARIMIARSFMIRPPTWSAPPASRRRAPRRSSSHPERPRVRGDDCSSTWHQQQQREKHQRQNRETNEEEFDAVRIVPHPISSSSDQEEEWSEGPSMFPVRSLRVCALAPTIEMQ